MPSPLTRGSSRCRMLATLGRVGNTHGYGVTWYNHDCTQRPPHARVCVTLPRGTDAVCGAVCVVANRKTRAVQGWSPVTARAS